MLDRFAIDFSLCMYCGICIEACPFDALFWSPEFEYAEYDIRDLLHEKDTLREWMWTVPAPPAHDPLGEPAKEETRAEGRRRTGAFPPTSSTTSGQGRCRGSRDRRGCAAGRARGGRDRIGVRVVATTHLVRAGLWLVVTLAAIAGMYLVLGAELVAWVQILLYVGAVVVLLLFAVMLTRAPIGSSPDLDRPRDDRRADRRRCRRSGSARCSSTRTTGRSSPAPPAATAENVGTAVFRTWALPFEVLSVLLLAALVGAIVVSRPGTDGAASGRLMHPVIPYLVAAVLFGLGIYGVLVRRNAVLLLAAVELHAERGQSGADHRGHHGAGRRCRNAGSVFALFVIVLAAAEIGVGLAIVLQLYRLRGSITVGRDRRSASGIPDTTEPD